MIGRDSILLARIGPTAGSWWQDAPRDQFTERCAQHEPRMQQSTKFASILGGYPIVPDPARRRSCLYHEEGC